MASKRRKANVKIQRGGNLKNPKIRPTSGTCDVNHQRCVTGTNADVVVSIKSVKLKDGSDNMLQNKVPMNEANAAVLLSILGYKRKSETTVCEEFKCLKSTNNPQRNMKSTAKKLKRGRKSKMPKSVCNNVVVTGHENAPESVCDDEARMEIDVLAEVEADGEMYPDDIIDNDMTQFPETNDESFTELIEEHNPVKRHRRKKGTIVPLKCDYCPHTTMKPSDLARHIRTHTNEKPYVCSICGYRCSGDLKRHMRIHSNDKPHKCSFCGRCFLHKGTLTTHIYTHTNENPFTCSFCPESFKQATHLKTHMWKHCTVKPFLCSDCGKSFRDNKSLLLHKHTTKPYRCMWCGYSSIREHLLKKHTFLKHKSKIYLASQIKVEESHENIPDDRLVVDEAHPS